MKLLQICYTFVIELLQQREIASQTNIWLSMQRLKRPERAKWDADLR